MTAERRKNDFEEQLRGYPGIAAGGSDAFLRQGHWHKHFQQRIGQSFSRRIVLEVGCADAAFLAEVAAKHPTVAFVGLDWKFKSLLTGAKRIAAAELPNVALLRGRAADLPQIFSPGEVDEIWVFHPEPCDEPQQRMNRLIAERFLTDAFELLSGERSIVAIKTDHVGYFQRVLALAGAAAPPLAARAKLSEVLPPDQTPPANKAVIDRFTVAAMSADFWEDRKVLEHISSRSFAGAATPFESRFISKRRPIYYVELRKK